MEKQNKKIIKEIHPYWDKLMKYVEKNGGYLRLEIRFQHGLPISAERVREQIRFDIERK